MASSFAAAISVGTCGRSKTQTDKLIKISKINKLWQRENPGSNILAFTTLRPSSYLAVLLLLPVPFFNDARALFLIAIALGIIHRDGIMVAVGNCRHRRRDDRADNTRQLAGELLTGWSAFKWPRFGE